MKRKLLSLLTLALATVGIAWADSGTESSGNTGTNNSTLVGNSYSLDGKFIAGKGGVKQGNMPDKGVKLRSNQGNLVFQVNAGYKITGFKFWGCGNTATDVTVESATVDDGSNLLDASVELPGKGHSKSGDIVLSDIEATDNITLTFATGSSAQIVGTWTIDYIQTEVVVQEITAVSINGSAISTEDLATLKSSKALTIDGSSFNGLGAVDVTLSSGATTVNRAISGDNAVYTFTINGTDNYTITVTNVVKTYEAAKGSVVYYSVNGNKVTGADGTEVTANGITFTYPQKTFQYGAGSITLGSVAYQPLKLSTGEAVTVTFPEGKKASKLIVYGWSMNGNGKLTAIQETNDEEGKKVDCSGDIFYALNTASDYYPSVYEYELDDWESMYFTAGGSASQPFIVMQFFFTTETVTIPSSGFATIASSFALDCANLPSGVKAYKVSEVTASGATLVEVTEAVAAGTGLILEGAAGSYEIPVVASGTDISASNKLQAAVKETDVEANAVYVLYDGKFCLVDAASAVPAGKAYLLANDIPAASARPLTIQIGDKATGINKVQGEEVQGSEIYNLQGQRVVAPTKGLYIMNGKKVIIK